VLGGLCQFAVLNVPLHVNTSTCIHESSDQTSSHHSTTSGPKKNWGHTLTALPHILEPKAVPIFFFSLSDMTPLQARPPSSVRSNSDGSAYFPILEHAMAYPGTYEIPLRTMYTINSSTRAQPFPQQSKQQRTSGSQGRDSQDATAQFQSSLMSQLSQLPSQPTSLPPSFINSFVRRCFTADLLLVDFPQALTALDYLKDLEQRRRREFAAALTRLGLPRDNLAAELEHVAQMYPGVADWVRQLQDKEKKVEALYTQIYVGLRRWVSRASARAPKCSSLMTAADFDQ
jgi:hypothetical protein